VNKQNSNQFSFWANW